MTLELENRIRRLAHRFWEEEGRPEGKSEEHWRRAKASLDVTDEDLPSESVPYGDPREAGVDGQSRQTAGDPDGAQSGMTKEQVFLEQTTRQTPD